MRSPSNFTPDSNITVDDGRIIAKNLPPTTTSYTDPNRPTDTEYYAAIYLKQSGKQIDSQQGQTKTVPIGCTANQNPN